MKHILLHIILCCLLALSFTGCQDRKGHGSHTEGSRSLDVYPSRLCLADVGNHFTTNLDFFNNF